MPGSHTKYGPSGAYRYHNCNAAPAFIATIPPELRAPPHQAALLGTAAHGLLEHCLGKLEHPNKLLGRLIEIQGKDGEAVLLKASASAPSGRNWFVVDDDMVEGVQLAYEYVLKRCEDLFIDPKDGLILEGRTNPLPDREDSSGTADITLDASPILEVIDYKNGFVTVEATEQLFAYLTGRAEETGWSHTTYIVTVIQPNAFHPKGPIRSHEVTKEELKAFQARHREVIEAGARADEELHGKYRAQPKPDWQKAHLKAGGWCDMCEASIKCVVVKEHTEKELGVDMSKTPEEATPPEEVEWDVEHAARVAQWGPHAKKLIDAAKAFLVRAHEAGQTVPGKLVMSRTKRTLNPALGLSPEELATKLVDEGYVAADKRPELFKQATLIGGPAIEKLVEAKRRKEFAAAYLFKPEGTLEWAPDEDFRRPAASSGDGSEDFREAPPEDF